MDLPMQDEVRINEALFGSRPAAKARFYLHGARNEEETTKNGYPVYEDRVYIEIKIPDCADFMSQPANRQHFKEYPREYEYFQKYRDWKQHSLELLPGVTPAILATLQALGFHTVEHLAAHTPETAPWLKAEENPYPQLNGELPPSLQTIKEKAISLVAFWTNPPKPRLRLVDGKLEQVA